MPWSSFEALNAERAEQGEQLLANQKRDIRTMKLLDSRVGFTGIGILYF